MSEAVVTTVITGLVIAGAVVLMNWLIGPTPKPAKPAGPCPALIEQHEATGVPAHINIKCREFL